MFLRPVLRALQPQVTRLNPPHPNSSWWGVEQAWPLTPPFLIEMKAEPPTRPPRLPPRGAPGRPCSAPVEKSIHYIFPPDLCSDPDCRSPSERNWFEQRGLRIKQACTDVEKVPRLLLWVSCHLGFGYNHALHERTNSFHYWSLCELRSWALAPVNKHFWQAWLAPAQCSIR